MASVLLVLPEQTKCNVIYSNLGSTCENNLIKRRKYMEKKPCYAMLKNVSRIPNDVTVARNTMTLIKITKYCTNV